MKGVGVFYPASKFNLSHLQSGCELFEELTGIKPLVPDLPPELPGYSVGSREARLKIFKELLLNDEIDVLWAARGGYGCIDLLSDLEDHVEVLRKKTIVGFSDVTALHAFLSNRGISSIHGPMVATEPWNECEPEVREGLLACLSGEKIDELPFKGSLEARGRLVGGNLCTLAGLMGTPYQLKLRPGDILFLEEINEPHYKLVRSLKQLSYSPNFMESTVLWGHLTECTHPFSSTSELVADLMDPYGIAHAYGLPSGHEYDNVSLMLNSEVVCSEQKLRFVSKS